MAEVGLDELISIIKQHPDYYARLEMDLPADQALYIRISPAEGRTLDSYVLEGKGGVQIAIDHDAEGLIYGIEIT